MSALDAVRRAHEEKFFKTEQEAEVRRYVARLKAEGRYERAMAEAETRAKTRGELRSTALPQIMAHSLRFGGTEEAEHVRRVIDRDFMTKHRLVTNLGKYTDGFLLGGRVSLGKNKWTAGTTASGVEGTTIFSVHKATELMSSQPKHAKFDGGLETRAARHMVDNTFVEVAGRKIKLMPDPTPGRAMAWGGTLAIWGTAAITLTSCKLLGIRSVSDVGDVMKRHLQPCAEYIRDTMMPLKTRFAMDSSSSANFKDTDFAHGIRRVFA